MNYVMYEAGWNDVIPALVFQVCLHERIRFALRTYEFAMSLQEEGRLDDYARGCRDCYASFLKTHKLPERR